MRGSLQVPWRRNYVAEGVYSVLIGTDETKPDMSDPNGTAGPEPDPDEAFRIRTEHIDKMEKTSKCGTPSSYRAPPGEEDAHSVAEADSPQDEEPNVPHDLAP